MLRDTIKQATIDAMKAGDKPRVATLRQVSAKIKDRDIELRTVSAPPADDELVTEVLLKMAKQRRESIAMFADGGRTELAAQEQAELEIIEEFLPTKLDERATRAAIDAVKAELGAGSLKDMGRVMAELRTRHGASLDMGQVSGWVKEALALGGALA